MHLERQPERKLWQISLADLERQLDGEREGPQRS